jgi:Family of unknown function (DUF5681)
MSRKDDQPNEVPGPEKPVGYGSPPQATRFKKGVSGNPKGRPKGSLNVASAFAKTLRERVVINENGKRKTVTKLEAALKQLVNKAASGDLRACAQLVALARDAEAKLSMPGTQEPVLGNLDQEVMDGIMKRFLKAGEEEEEKLQPGVSEETNGHNERG